MLASVTIAIISGAVSAAPPPADADEPRLIRNNTGLRLVVTPTKDGSTGRLAGCNASLNTCAVHRWERSFPFAIWAAALTPDDSIIAAGYDGPEATDEPNAVVIAGIDPRGEVRWTQELERNTPMFDADADVTPTVERVTYDPAGARAGVWLIDASLERPTLQRITVDARTGALGTKTRIARPQVGPTPTNARGIDILPLHNGALELAVEPADIDTPVTTPVTTTMTLVASDGTTVWSHAVPNRAAPRQVGPVLPVYVLEEVIHIPMADGSERRFRPSMTTDGWTVVEDR